MSGGWQQVQDEQIDLLRMWRGPAGDRVQSGFGHSMGEVEKSYGNSAGVILSTRLKEVSVHSLERADPFYVDDEMMDVVESAALTFEPERLKPTDFITPSAFVVLPRPMSMMDRHGVVCNFRAILWNEVDMIHADTDVSSTVAPTPDEKGVLLSLYSNVYDLDGYHERNDEKFGPGWQDKIVGATGSVYSLLHITPWVYEQEFPSATDITRQGFWTPVQAFLRLSMQTIAEHHAPHPPRASMKRWKKVMHTDKYVTVIRLRRPRSHSGEPTQTVDWSHRWIVNGHWRNQWFPSLNEHRQIWIGAHVKGPESKPLLVRRGRAFEFVK